MAGLLKAILRDYLCRVSPAFHCSTGNDGVSLDDALRMALSHGRGAAVQDLDSAIPDAAFFQSQGVAGNRRVTLDVNSPVQVLGKNPNRTGIIISVISNAPVWFSTLDADLQQTDTNTGVPTRGWLVQGPSLQPIIIKGYSNDLWARTRSGLSGVQLEVAEYSQPNSYSPQGVTDSSGAPPVRKVISTVKALPSHHEKFSELANTKVIGTKDGRKRDYR